MTRLDVGTISASQGAYGGITHDGVVNLELDPEVSCFHNTVKNAVHILRVNREKAGDSCIMNATYTCSLGYLDPLC